LSDYTLQRFLDALPDTRLKEVVRQYYPEKTILSPKFNQLYLQARAQLFERLLPTNRAAELNKKRAQITEEEEHDLELTEQCDLILKNIKKAIYAIQELSLRLKGKTIQVVVRRSCQEIDLSKLDVVKFSTTMALNLWQKNNQPDLSQFSNSPYIPVRIIA